MKTIEVTDEMYNALIDLSKEMTTQDMRATAMPHMFQVRSEEQVAAYPGQGHNIWVNEEGGELKTEEEIREYIQEYILENDETLSDLSDEEAKTEAERRVGKMDTIDLEIFLEDEHHWNWWKVAVTTEYKYQNTFFTAKACEAHIKANYYHYKNPVCYLNHAFRNPEMELISKFLCELSGCKYEKIVMNMI